MIAMKNRNNRVWHMQYNTVWCYKLEVAKKCPDLVNRVCYHTNVNHNHIQVQQLKTKYIILKESDETAANEYVENEIDEVSKRRSNNLVDAYGWKKN